MYPGSKSLLKRDVIYRILSAVIFLNTSFTSFNTITARPFVSNDSFYSDGNAIANPCQPPSEVNDFLPKEAITLNISSIDVKVFKNDTSKEKDYFDFSVHFSKGVELEAENQDSELSFTIENKTRHAEYQSGSGSSILVFRYESSAEDENLKNLMLPFLTSEESSLKKALIIDSLKVDNTQSIGNSYEATLNLSNWKNQGVTFLVTNVKPVFTSEPITAVNENGIYNYTIVTTDEDGNATSITAPELPTWLNLTSTFEVSTLPWTGDIENGPDENIPSPKGIAIDKTGNIIITDIVNHLIRKVSPEGVITTLAGSGIAGNLNGNGTEASFSSPSAITLDAQGNIFLTESGNNDIRKITPNGDVTTIAGSGAWGDTNGNGTEASFKDPRGIAVDGQGNVFVCDLNAIRKITPNGDVTTLANIDQPNDLAVDRNGNVFVSQNNNLIGKITPDGTVSIFAGGLGVNYETLDGNGTNSRFVSPRGIQFDSAGNLYVTEWFGVIRKITPNRDVTTIVNNGSGTLDGNAAEARFHWPNKIAIDNDGDFFIVQGDYLIRKMTWQTNISGTAPSQSALHNVSFLANDGNGGMTTQNFTIAVEDVTLPVFTSTTQTSFEENETGIAYSATATDSNTLTYSLGTEQDEALFDISGSTGGVSFKNAPDFEKPLDGDGKNSYVINVMASDGTITVDQNVVITVTNIYEEPVFTSTPITFVNENVTYNYKVRTTMDEGAVTITSPIKPSWLEVRPSREVSTLAGSDNRGILNGNGTNARFAFPTGVATDALGNIYISDLDNHSIRKIAPNGDVTSFVGIGYRDSSDGNGSSAGFNKPTSLAVDTEGNIYVADSENHLIRKIAPNGDVTTLAGSGSPGFSDGLGTLATFNNPTGLVVDVNGNLYVADRINQRIRKITPNGQVTTFAGSGEIGNSNGLGTLATFNYPIEVAIDANGNVYVADQNNHLIRRITSQGKVSTFAGAGLAGSANGARGIATFNYPSDVAVDAHGYVFIADHFNNLIRMIDAKGVVSTLAGSGNYAVVDGNGTAASFYQPRSLAIDASGNVIVTEAGSHRIRKITSQTTLTGQAPSQAGTYQVSLSVSDSQGGSIQSFTIAVNDVTPPEFTSSTSVNFEENRYGVAHMVSLIESNPFTYSLGSSYDEGLFEIFNNGVIAFKSPPDYENPIDIGNDNTYKVKVLVTDGTFTVNQEVNITVTDLDEEFAFTSVPTATIDDDEIYVYDISTNRSSGFGANISATTKPSWLQLTNVWQVTTLEGPASTGEILGASIGVAVDSEGNIIVADKDNHVIEKIAPNGEVAILAGSGTSGNANGIGTAASFSGPTGVALDKQGNIYVADGSNHLIRKISTDGEVTTLAGSGSIGYSNGKGTAASFNLPFGIAVDPEGNVIVTSLSDYRIRKITPDGNVSTFAGNVLGGNLNGVGTAALFRNPTHIAVDAIGFIYVVDQGNNLIRKITPDGLVSIFAGSGTSITKDGNGLAAGFNIPSGITVDDQGNLYVSELGGQVIRKIALNRDVITIAGSGDAGYLDGNGTEAVFKSPNGIDIDGAGNLVVADGGNRIIRKLFTQAQLISDQMIPSGTHNVALLAAQGEDTAEQNFTITVNDVTSPVITSATSTTFSEEATGVVYTMVAIDANPLIFSLGTEKDEVLFDIDQVTGEITFKAAPDFENPTDNDGDNVYIIQVIASDQVNSADQEVSINVTNVNADPIFTSTPITSVRNNAIYNYTIKTNDEDRDAVLVTPTTIPTWLELKWSAVSEVTHLAGSVDYVNSNGKGSEAGFSYIDALVIDEAGNIIVADFYNHLIRKITPDGIVTTVAGSGIEGNDNGHGTEASFKYPFGLAIDGSGNIYVSEYGNYDIRKISPNGDVTTFAGSGVYEYKDGNGTSASFTTPSAMVFDAGGNLIVTDKFGHRIRKVAPNGDVTTLAGSGEVGSENGFGTAASFSGPSGIVVDSKGNFIVTDYFNSLIRKITPDGEVTTIAGSGASGGADGVGTAASFKFPEWIAIDSQDQILVTDRNGLRSISPDGLVTTFSLSLNSGEEILFPRAVTIDPSGHGILASDRAIYKFKIDSKLTGSAIGQAGIHNIVLSATDGNGGIATQNFSITINDAISFISPTDVSFIENGVGIAYTVQASADNTLSYGLGAGKDEALFNINAITGDISFKSIPDFEHPIDLGGDNSYFIKVIAYDGVISAEQEVIITVTNVNDSPAFTSTPVTRLYAQTDYKYNITANDVDLSTMEAIVKPDWLALGTASLNTIGSGIAGFADGDEISSAFNGPIGIAVDVAGNMYVSDNNRIRKISPSGKVSTFAGSGVAATVDGTGIEASFNTPFGLSFDNSGNLLVAELIGLSIRKVSPQGEVTTIVNGLTQFADVATDSKGNIYATAIAQGVVYKIDKEGVMSQFASNLQEIFGITIDGSDNVYVAQIPYKRISKITPSGEMTTVVSDLGANAYGLDIDLFGNIYTSNNENNQLIKIEPSGTRTTVMTGLNRATSVAVGTSGKIYVANSLMNTINTNLGDVLTLTGNPGDDIGNHNVELKVSDGQDGTISQSFEITVINPDTPQLISSNPMDDARNFNGSTLTLTFNRDVQKGNGAIKVLDASNDTEVFVLGVNHSGVKVNGAVVTIDMRKSLSLDKELYLNIDPTAFKDGEGLFYAGISDKTTLNFSSKTTPKLTSSTPSDGATQFTGKSIQLTFDRNVFKGYGAIYLRDASNDNNVWTVGVNHPTVSVSGTVVTLKTGELPADREFYLNIDATAFKDGEDLFYAGISNKTTLNFSGKTTPKLTSSTPFDGASQFTRKSIELTFDRAVLKGSGVIYLRDASNDNNVWSVGVNHPNVRVSGAVVTLNTGELPADKEFYLNIDPTAFKDGEGLFYAGISDKTTLNFSGNTTPKLTSSTPLDGATQFTGKSIELTFDRAIFKGSGVIYLRDASNENNVWSVGVNHPNVRVSGAVVTLNTGELPTDIEFYLNIGPTVFKDDRGLFYNGIQDKTTLNFRGTVTPKLIASAPLDNAINFTASVITLTFTENVLKGSGLIGLYNAEDDTELWSRGVNNPRVSINGAVVTFNLETSLPQDKNVYLKIATTAFKNETGTFFLGIQDKTTLNFSTPSSVSGKAGFDELSLDIKPVVTTEGIRIYPNPTSGVLNIDLSNAGEEPTVTISDLSGKEMFRQSKIGQELLVLSLDHYNEGVYLLRVKTKSGVLIISKLSVVK
jgi:sugar lactone lactonase YvrE